MSIFPSYQPDFFYLSAKFLPQNTYPIMRIISIYLYLMLLLGQVACQSGNGDEEQDDKNDNQGTKPIVETEQTNAKQKITAPENIVDFFRLLPPEATNANYKQLEGSLAKGLYVPNPYDTNRNIPVQVDLKNAYLKFVDNAIGGGSFTLEATLFRGSKSRAFVGVNQSFFDGISRDSDLHFWEYLGEGKWQEATNDIWGDVTPLVFFEEGFKPKVKAENLADLLPINYSLPRIGTTAQAKIYTGKFAVLCKQGEDSPPLSEEAEEICRLKSRIKYTSLVMTWNSAKNKFDMSKKN